MKETIYSGREDKTEQIYSKELEAYLQYKLICTPDPLREKTISDKVYSLLVIKIAELDEVETRFFYDIARNIDKAKSIIDSMLYHAVSPLSADEILHDLI